MAAALQLHAMMRGLGRLDAHVVDAHRGLHGFSRQQLERA
jgi:hypothetical protein